MVLAVDRPDEPLRRSGVPAAARCGGDRHGARGAAHTRVIRRAARGAVPPPQIASHGASFLLTTSYVELIGGKWGTLVDFGERGYHTDAHGGAPGPSTRQQVAGRTRKVEARIVFVGEYDRSVDGNGRLALPSTFRDDLGDRCYVTRHPLVYLAVYVRERLRADAEEVLAKVRRGEMPESATGTSVSTRPCSRSTSRVGSRSTTSRAATPGSLGGTSSSPARAHGPARSGAEPLRDDPRRGRRQAAGPGVDRRGRRRCGHRCRSGRRSGLVTAFEHRP